jgi:hypothetical protein
MSNFIRVKLFIICIIILNIITSELTAKTMLAPYSLIDFSLGVTAASRGITPGLLGSFLFTTNLTTDLGLIIKPADKHSILLFYELKYIGPGLKTTEGREFTERTMDNMLFTQYQLNLKDKYTLKVGFNWMKEYLRSGANEEWGAGLYDFNRIGGQVEFGIEKKLMGLIGYDMLDFPNYTDLLKEFQMGASTEPIAGKASQNIIQIGANYSIYDNDISFRYSIQNYTKQKVVESNGVYGNNLQVDNVIDLKLSRSQPLSKILVIKPDFEYRIKTSNQNYLHFVTIMSTTPIFIGKYYDYTEIDFAIPLYINLTKNKSIFFIPNIILKNYSDRPARDINNNLLTEKETDSFTIISLGYTVKWNRVSNMTLIYSYQSQTSNMKYERYIPYNYTGSFIGTKLNFSY